jgi:xanthosine utilization system XapX-like protein
MENEYLNIKLKKPVKPTISLLFIMGQRRGNQILFQGNKVVGLIVHKNDWEDVKKMVGGEGNVSS